MSFVINTKALFVVTMLASACGEILNLPANPVLVEEWPVQRSGLSSSRALLRRWSLCVLRGCLLRKRGPALRGRKASRVRWSS